MSVESCTAHIEGELQQFLAFIKARHNTTRLLMRRSGHVERRVQRRVVELLKRGWIEQTGRLTAPASTVRVFGLTEEGRRNVPSRP